MLLALAIFILMLLADHPAFIERYYSNGLYPLICHLLHPVFNLFPFSIGDLLYIAVVIYLAYALFRLVWLTVKRRWMQAGTFLAGIIIGIQAGILVFYLFWGMNYFRPRASQRLNLPDSGYSVDDLKQVAAIMIDSANASRARLTGDDLNTSNKAIFNTAINAINQLSGTSAHFTTYQPQIKASLLSFLLNYIGTSGYYNPFTTEAQMNYQMPVYLRPFVACHEMSHQMGYGPEDEANFVGFLAGSRSNNRLLHYSAYYIGAEEFLYALRQQDSTAQKLLKRKLSPLVLADFKHERTYWLSYEGKLGVLSSIFYDDFLKANNQPQGLKTYNRMIILVMGYYKAHKL